jgi:hypothetical protein
VYVPVWEYEDDEVEELYGAMEEILGTGWKRSHAHNHNGRLKQCKA